MLGSVLHTTRITVRLCQSDHVGYCSEYCGHLSDDKQCSAPSYQVSDRQLAQGEAIKEMVSHAENFI